MNAIFMLKAVICPSLDHLGNGGQRQIVLSLQGPFGKELAVITVHIDCHWYFLTVLSFALVCSWLGTRTAEWETKTPVRATRIQMDLNGFLHCVVHAVC